MLARTFRSAIIMTPAGDAIRGWIPLILALVITYLLFPGFRFGQQNLLPALMFLDLFYALFLILTWIAVYRTSPEELRLWAFAQGTDASRWRRLMQLLTGVRVFSGKTGLSMIVGFSLVGILFALALLPQGGEFGTEILRAPLCVIGVITSWTLLHTAYALHYAHLYYGKDPAGGLAFPGGEAPGPLDFVYFSFTVGISFAVSDVEISSRRMRRVALWHAILAFFYNTAILALVLNLVIGGV